MKIALGIPKSVRDVPAVAWVLASLAFVTSPLLAQTASAMRAWVDQQGRTITASIVDTAQDQVVFQLATGSVARFPMAKLSIADQKLVREWCLQHGKPDPGLVSKGGGWPDKVVAGDLSVLTVSEDAAARKFVYRAGPFQFTTQMKLAPSVMKGVAHDFELTRQLLEQMPWGWQPRPAKGDFFEATIYETEKDYNDAGGQESTSGTTDKDRAILTFGASVGLKKVAQSFARDEKYQGKNSLLALLVRDMIGDMRPYLQPWASGGMEEFMAKLAYHNGAFTFAPAPERFLKEQIKENAQWKLQPSVADMLTYLKLPWSDVRDDGPESRRKSYFNKMLLVYYFAYWDGDGKGTRLNQYFSAVARETMTWRLFGDSQKSGGKSVPYPGQRKPIEEQRQEFMQIILGGRSDAQLSQEIAAKFKANGIKVN